MKKALLLGTLLGGLVAFVWSSISWELLGWHEKPLRAFQNEDEVSAVILSHTTESGIYLLPGSSSPRKHDRGTKQGRAGCHD